MTPAEQRLIEAVRERALASVTYAKAVAIDEAAKDARTNVYMKARDAADKAYQAVLKKELGSVIEGTEDALRTASEDWGTWDVEYTAALKAMTEETA